MDTEYVQMFEIEFEDDSLKDGKLNMRNEFVRKVYLFFTLNLIMIAILGIVLQNYFYYDIEYVNWIFLLFSLLFQIYFQHYGKFESGEYRKIISFIIGSLSIISNTVSYNYLIRIIDYQLFDQVQYLYDYDYLSYLAAFAQLFIVVFILMFISNASEFQLRSHEAWIVALITPYFLQFIYDFIYLDYYQYSWINVDRIQMYPAIITWLAVLIVMMTQEIKALNEDYEAIFINSCRLTGVFFQIFVYAGQFVYHSRRNDDLVIESNAIQKLQYLRKISTILSIITLIILLIIIGVVQVNNTNYLVAAFINSNGNLKLFFWVCVGLSLLFYALTIILKRYHWIISWTLFILQIIFYTLVIIGISSYLVFNHQNSYLLSVAFCTFNGIFIGLVSYTFVEKKQFQIFKAFLYMSICPFMIYIIQLYPNQYYDLSYAYSTYILIGFELYALMILLEFYLHLNHAFLQFKLSDYCIGAMLAYEPFLAILTRPFGLCFTIKQE